MFRARTGRERRVAPGLGAQEALLLRLALPLAGVSVVAVLVPVYFGFDVPEFVVFLLLLVCFFLFWPPNRIAVRTMVWNGGGQLPVWRWLMSLAVAVVVAFAGLLWAFENDIQAVRAPIPEQERIAETETLVAKREERRAVAMIRAIPVEQDPEVLRLQAELKDTRERAEKARERELCELDGTCGTGDDGIGTAYIERQRHRLDLERRVSELTLDVERARAESRQRFDQVGRDAQAAAADVDEIEERLTVLRLSAPDGRGTVDAVVTLGSRDDIRVLFAMIGFAALFLFIDIGALRLAVRQVCSSNRRPRQDLVAVQDDDSARARRKFMRQAKNSSGDDKDRG